MEIGVVLFRKNEVTSCEPDEKIVGLLITTTSKPIITRTTTRTEIKAFQSTERSSTTPTTTTKMPNPVFCPPTLSEPTKSTIRLALNETNSLTSFKKYYISYLSSVGSTNPMIMFEFNTVWGS